VKKGRPQCEDLVLCCSASRVGRNFFRAVDAQHAAGTTDIEIVAVNDLTDNETLAHLLKYDSVLGRLAHEVSVVGEDIVVGDQVIKAWSIADGPAALPWGDLGVDVVIESTGRYTAAEQARRPVVVHLRRGTHQSDR